MVKSVHFKHFYRKKQEDMGIKIRKQDALNYHSQEPAGKIEVVATKMVSTQRDLALAYSPGVAEPCLEIEKNPEDIYKYTSKGNLVGVISNGTAVLGLGNIGAGASKPVMEGKGVLFKKFAGIDVFDIEINETDPEKFVQIVKSLEPTFGGINLEDIKAPESFEIETRLKEELNIPVMHDDQHGTAIISAAAMMNALELIEKDIDKVKLVVNGAGAAAMSCTKLYMSIGVRKENIIMCDSKGVLHVDREDLDKYKQHFAVDSKAKTLEEAVSGADIFVGLSIGNVLTPDMVKSMAVNPIIFALANPTPEIAYDLAMKTRNDVIMATGRSDHPNQVNNVLGFPYIFRGALDVRATEINEEMKLAAVYAIAELTKEPVPDSVNKIYNEKNITFSKTYLIPKPIDPRLITAISPAVAKAAIESGVAKVPIKNWTKYVEGLEERIGIDQKLMSRVIYQAKKNAKKVVFAEADHHKVLKAAQIVRDEGIAEPILLGRVEKIRKIIEDNGLELHDCKILDPYAEDDKLEQFGEIYYKKRQRKGVSKWQTSRIMRDRNYFGAMMVETGEADALISGLTNEYPKTIRPALEIIGTEPEVKKVAGMYIMLDKKEPYFLADTSVSRNPNPEQLVDIVGLTAKKVEYFNVKPRIAMVSYSNFGSSNGDTPTKMKMATKLAKEKYPELTIDGEMQADIALSRDLIKENYPFSELADKGANTLVFPNLESGNIAYKLLSKVGGCEAIGPILMGMNKPVHILQIGSSVRDIVNMVAIAVVDAQKQEEQVVEKEALTQ